MTPLKTAWHHIRRSPVQSFTAILIMSLCSFLISSYFIINQGLSSVLNYFETKPEITIFLKDGLDRNTIEGLQKELSDYPDIREIKYISKEKALNIYKEQNKNNPMLTEMVTASILPASFEVSVTNPAILEQIAYNFSAKTKEVDEIIYQKDIIASLLNWTNLVRRVGIVLMALIVSISFLIILIIVGMKITNRKEEIRVSRLLGASKFYVKKPFLIEGSFYGLIGATIGILSSLSLAFYFQEKINIFFNPVVFINNDLNFYLYLSLSQVIFGIFVGYLASWFGVKRFIKY